MSKIRGLKSWMKENTSMVALFLLTLLCTNIGIMLYVGLFPCNEYFRTRYFKGPVQCLMHNITKLGRLFSISIGSHHPPLITNIQVLLLDIAWICKLYAKFIYHDQGYISKNTKIHWKIFRLYMHWHWVHLLHAFRRHWIDTGLVSI